MSGFLEDFAAGCFVVGALLGAAWGIHWVWVHGWHWPAWVLVAGAAVLMLATVGRAVRGNG